MAERISQWLLKNMIFRNSILGLNQHIKTFIALFSDYLLLTISFYLSLSIRSNSFYIPTLETAILIALAPLLAIPIFYFFGLYKAFVRYSSYQVTFTIIKGVSFYTLIWFLIVYFSGIVNQPYDFLAINWMLSVFLSVAIRWLAGWLLSEKKDKAQKVLIYGAGEAGIQLFNAIKSDPEISIVAFLDDSPNKQGRFIESLKINHPKSLKSLIIRKHIDEILIAIPSLPKKDMNDLLQSLKKHEVKLRVLPGFSDLAHGRASITDLKKVKIEDLLKRDIRQPIKELISKDVTDKIVLVTGAGGSIGSQLSREIVYNQPKKLLILDFNEFNLYQLERELLTLESDIELIPILCSVTDKEHMKRVLKTFGVNTVYHAAAYKHVPMVEKNIIPSLKTNILGTQVTIEAAIYANVESFVFISTDKAVRPTNIMGASKRFAELILQAYSDLKNVNIRISVVRFGNVLGSSGSVVPLFREQIQKGGPLTVTDPQIIRYFMTIDEAAQLVIQAGAMGQDGDIFLLDMGEPVRILTLAKDMIRLSGHTVKDEENPQGDIEIKYTGLRPGEKLYEELLIGSDVKSTEHRKIFRATESGISMSNLEEYLLNLEEAMKSNDLESIQKLFSHSVSGYKNIYGIMDPMKN